MGVFSPPPPDGTSYPDIPVLNIEPAAKQAAAGATKSGWWDDLVNKYYHGFTDGLSWVITSLAGGMDDVFAFFLHFVTAAQGVNQPGFLALMSGVLEDLLGLQFDSAELIASVSKGGRLGGMQKAGGWLFDSLKREFSPAASGAQQVASDAPARAFIGFLIEFAVRQGNVAAFAEFLPSEFNVFSGLREYGELLARNLGLGRLARQALRPLMQTMVADPLQWQLNSTYRPKLLSEGQAAAAYHSGVLTQDEATQILTYMGYRDRDISYLLTRPAHHWSHAQLIDLWRSGAISDAEAQGKLIAAGAEPQDAILLWQSYLEADKHVLVADELAQYFHLARQGYLDIALLRDIIATTVLTPAEREHYDHLAGIIAEYPRKHITESELERAFLGGVIDMTTTQDFWTRLGYSPDSIQVLTLLLLQKQSTSNRTKPGHTPHKALTEAQLEKAYANGILNLMQLQAGWHALGYSADDVLVLSQLVQLKTPGPGDTTLPGVTTP